MSLLGYVSALMHLILSGAQAAQNATAQAHNQSPAPTGTGAKAPPAPGFTSDGLGQLGHILEAMLGWPEQSTSAAAQATGAAPSSNASAASGTPSAEVASGGKTADTASGSAGTPPSAAAGGLGTALSHVSNANAQTVLQALLGAATAGANSTTENPEPSLLPDLSAVDLTEAEARALAESRTLAARDENILARIAQVANATGDAGATSPDAAPGDFGQTLLTALMAQINAAHPALGAYSSLSLAAISSGAPAVAAERARPVLFL